MDLSGSLHFFNIDLHNEELLGRATEESGCNQILSQCLSENNNQESLASIDHRNIVLINQSPQQEGDCQPGPDPLASLTEQNNEKPPSIDFSDDKCLTLVSGPLASSSVQRGDPEINLRVTNLNVELQNVFLTSGDGMKQEWGELQNAIDNPLVSPDNYQVNYSVTTTTEGGVLTKRCKMTLLEYCCLFNDTSDVKKLIDRNCSVSNTPMTLQYVQRHTSKSTTEKFSALDLAYMHGNKAVIALLEKKNAIAMNVGKLSTLNPNKICSRHFSRFENSLIFGVLRFFKKQQKQQEVVTLLSNYTSNLKPNEFTQNSFEYPRRNIYNFLISFILTEVSDSEDDELFQYLFKLMEVQPWYREEFVGNVDVEEHCRKLIDFDNNISGDMVLIPKYLNAKGNINATDKNARTLLHRAARKKNLNLVEFLVQRGADMNLKDRNGDTPLMQACKYGNNSVELVEYLLENGADQQIKNKRNITPLGHVTKIGLGGIKIILKDYLNGRKSSSESRRAKGKNPIEEDQESQGGGIIDLDESQGGGIHVEVIDLDESYSKGSSSSSQMEVEQCSASSTEELLAFNIAREPIAASSNEEGASSSSQMEVEQSPTMRETSEAVVELVTSHIPREAIAASRNGSGLGDFPEEGFGSERLENAIHTAPAKYGGVDPKYLPNESCLQNNSNKDISGGGSSSSSMWRPNILVVPKYLKGVDGTSTVQISSGENSGLTERCSYFNLSILGSYMKRCDEQIITTTTNIGKNNELQLIHLDGRPIDPKERVTFVRAGRGASAYVPKEIGGGRVVLVIPEQDKNNFVEYVNENCNVLVINSLPQIEDKDLGLCGPRWLAIFMAAYELKLENSIIIDDNIESIIVKKGLLDDSSSWKNVYDIYSKASQPEQLSVVSTASLRPEHAQNSATKGEISLDHKSNGYKLFYINWILLKEIVGNYLDLIPPNYCVPLEDIFMQQIVREACNSSPEQLRKGNTAKISYETLVLKRSDTNKNACANANQERNYFANYWLGDLNVDSKPDYYRNAVEYIKEAVETSIKTHQSNAENIKYIDLPKVSQKLKDANEKKDEDPPVINSEMDVEGPSVHSDRETKNISTLTLLSNDQILSCADDFLNVVKTPIDEIIEDKDEFSKLRKPQKKSFHELQKLLTSGEKQAYFDIATGVGKSRIFIELANKTRAHLSTQNKGDPNRRHVLIVTPTIDINRKTYADEKLDSKNAIIVDSADVRQDILAVNEDFKSFEKIYTVIMCSKSFKNMLSDDDSKKIINKFGLFIFDEMHMMPKDLLEVVQNYSEFSNSLMLGFSATPGEVTSYFNNKCLVKYTAHEGVEDQYLSPWEVELLDQDAFSEDNLEETVIEKLQTIYPEENPNEAKQGFVWVSSIEEADRLAEAIGKGISSLQSKVFSYHSQVSAHNRQKMLSSFRRKKINVLIAVNTLQAGVDFPNASFAIIAKKNEITHDKYLQMAGRVMRYFEGKTAQIFIANGAIIDQERHINGIKYKRQQHTTILSGKRLREVSCPEETPRLQAPMTLDFDDWKVIPFPLSLTIDEVVNICMKMRGNDFSELYNEIYKKNRPDKAKQLVRFEKWQDMTSNLRNLYAKHLENTSSSSEITKPTVIIYEQENKNGKNIYTKLEEPASQNNTGKLYILKKKRKVWDNKEMKHTCIEHYQLLYTDFSECCDDILKSPEKKVQKVQRMSHVTSTPGNCN
jgi:superfamily II DNA or RNA helicase/ankyrin repeat protein